MPYGLGARARLWVQSVARVGGRGGRWWGSVGGRDRAGVEQRSWPGSGQGVWYVRGGVAAVGGWHVCGRTPIGPALSQVRVCDRPALPYRRLVSPAAPAWRTTMPGGAFAAVAPKQRPANNALHADLRESGRVDESRVATRFGWCDNEGGTARRRVNAGRSARESRCWCSCEAAQRDREANIVARETRLYPTLVPDAGVASKQPHVSDNETTISGGGKCLFFPPQPW
jgi:hypothetical protein